MTISSANPAVQIDATSAPVVTAPAPKPVVTNPKSSSRVVLWVVIGVIAIAVLVVARNHKTTTSESTSTATPAATATDTSAATPSAMASDTSSPASISVASAAPSAATTTAGAASDLAPVGIVAHYTATGATIFWSPAPGATGLTTYNVEASNSGGAFKLIATIPATQLSLDVTKGGTAGWTSFKISAVYSDGNTVAGKIFGLPGQFA